MMDADILSNSATRNTRINSLKQSITSSYYEYLRIENNKLNKLQKELNTITKRDAFLTNKHRNTHGTTITNTNDERYLYNTNIRSAGMDLIKTSIE